MKHAQPSRTAIGAAGYRAAHQLLERGSVFSDPFARTILGSDCDAIVAGLSSDAAQEPIRIFMAARSRFAEDCLQAAVSRGIRQVVVLGAGLDTFSLRNPYAEVGLRVFEVDHPVTQAWKLERLAQVGLTPPSSTVFAGVDFERQSLGPALVAAGFEWERPTFFFWLGVVPYLRQEAIMATLRFIASLPGSEVVFDYSEPLENFPPERRHEIQDLAARAAAIGEPWLSHFDPGDLSGLLRNSGFDGIEDLGLLDIATRYLGVAAMTTDAGPGPHVIRAIVAS
jgi:methyltransferase (TIGR00027 family)